jgi:hypothetical protein
MQKIKCASYMAGTFAIGLVSGCTASGSGPASSAPLSHASSIAVDATDAYWVNSGTSTVSSGTIIQRQNKAGGAVTALVTEPCGGMGAVAVDDGYVYWSHGYASTSCTASVSRMPKGGGPVEVLATGLIFEGEGGIVLDDQAVYVVAIALTASELMSVPSGLEHARSTVYSVAKSGGTPVPVAGPNVSGDPAVDGQGGVYWLSVSGDQPASPATTSIMRTDPDGTTRSLATVSGNVARLAFFGNRIYWVVSGYHALTSCIECDTLAIVQSMGPGDLAPVTSVTLAAGSLIHDAIVDLGGLWLSLEGTRSGLNVDYFTIDDHTGALVHVPNGGSPATALTGLPSASDLTADDTTVFATGDAAPLLVAK